MIQPAEWEPHAACWLAWPSAEDLWGVDLAAAQRSFIKLCDAIADLDEIGQPCGERLEILIPDETRELEARKHLGTIARFHRIPFGDIWLRDTAPIFVKDGGEIVAACFAFNGWGRKYILPNDDHVSAAIAAASGMRLGSFPWILEGGSVESDGEGTLITTRQCLLHGNRNVGLSAADLEAKLKSALGADRVLWLERGLLNDHTDGHVDTLARFVAAGRVVCMRPSADDPNAEVLEEIVETLAGMRDAAGRRLEVIDIPSPGKVVNGDGEVMPASYMNFYISNTKVIVPTYDSPYDDSALYQIRQLFPGRATIGISARAILSGGGAFHCITQQQPKGRTDE